MMTFFEALHPQFNRFVLGNAPVKKIASGFDWVEGPVWFGDGQFLLFSDIPNNRIMRWIPGIGVSEFRNPSHYANGHTRDLQGRLVSCEHGSRRVTRTEYDGTTSVIAERFEGKRLNSPNDVVVKSDDTIWFTDPHYGIMTNYEGFQAEQELGCYVYCYDPERDSLQCVITDMHCPNGLAFSPDENLLYVADTGRMFENDEQHIRAFSVTTDNSVRDKGVFHRVEPGCADGIRLDTDGNVWTSAADGIHCISPDGELLGKILVPEVVSNICFGGRARHQLFITATTSVYCVHLNREGAR